MRTDKLRNDQSQEIPLAPGDLLSLVFWERTTKDHAHVYGEWIRRRADAGLKAIHQESAESDRSAAIRGQTHTYLSKVLAPTGQDEVYQQKSGTGRWMPFQIRVSVSADGDRLRVNVCKSTFNMVEKLLERWKPGEVCAVSTSSEDYSVDPPEDKDMFLSREQIKRFLDHISSQVEPPAIQTEHEAFHAEPAYKIYKYVVAENPVEVLIYSSTMGHDFALLARDANSKNPAPSLRTVRGLAPSPLSQFLREQASVVEDWGGSEGALAAPQILESLSKFTERQRQAAFEPAPVGMDANEILDLVDESDNVVGALDRKQIYERDLHNFRLAYGLVMNNKGQIWTPRRVPEKTICPEHLDASVGGHVKSGEGYEDGFAREALEELNLDTGVEEVHYLGHLTPDKHGSYAFAKVYEIRSELEPEYNPLDFTDGEWLRPEEILKRESEGEKVKSDLLGIAACLVDGRLPN